MEPPKPLLMKLKDSLKDAMKSGNTDAKDVLRVLLSKIQLLQIKSDVSEEQIINLTKTVIAQNIEEIKFRVELMDTGDTEPVAMAMKRDAISKLENQNNYLKSFLPTFLTKEQITDTLSKEDNLQQINSASSAGAATGVAIKILKSLPEFAGMAIDGGLVKDVVISIYKK